MLNFLVWGASCIITEDKEQTNLNDQLIEELLVLRCQLGDRDALTELIERHQVTLHYFISRLLENSRATEDIYQDTWLTVIRKISTLKEPRAFSTWLYRIAHNYVYREFRKKRQIARFDEKAKVSDNVEYIEEDNLYFDDMTKLYRCLENLRPEHKEVIMLRFLKQMSYLDISRTTGCSLGTVRSRLHYAKLALKKDLEK